MASPVYFRRISPPSAASIGKTIDDFIESLSLTGALLGKNCLLKINAMSDELLPGRNTSPWVLAGTLDSVLRRFPNVHFQIVDADVAGSRQFAKACKNWGYDAIAASRGVPLVNLSEQPTRTIGTSNPVCPVMEFPAVVMDADSIINLPVLKTHVITGISCALKNHWGLLPRFRYQYHPHAAAVIAEINRQIKQTVCTIVDGTICMEGSGPKTGVPRICNVLLAGRDRVAVDSAVLAFMGMDAAQAPHVRKAEEFGVGTTAFEIRGDSFAAAGFQLPVRAKDLVSQLEAMLRGIPLLGRVLYWPPIAGCSAPSARSTTKSSG